MPGALRKRLRLPLEDALPAAEFELSSASDAMSAFEQICFAIPASGALIAVRDATGLHCVGSLGDAPEVGSRLPPDFGIALECLETGSVVFRDLPDDAQRVLRVGMTMEGVSQIRSAVVLPMRAGNIVVGLIAVFSLRNSSIQPRDIEALERIADFWGPFMAEEWFPDGIPSTITATAAATALAPSLEEETPIVDAVPVAESTSVEEVAPVEEALPIEDMASADEATSIGEVVEQSASPIIAEPLAEPLAEPSLQSPVAEPLIANAINPQEPASFDREGATLPPERPESIRASEPVSSAEIGALTRAANQIESPVFLAPAEPIPAEAFHSGEPHRLTWLVVLAVFLIVLLPFWYLRSHWKHSIPASQNSVSASNVSSPNATSSAVNSASSATPANTPGKIPNNTNQPHNSSNPAPQNPPALAPDEEMPKPLPDLTEQPDANTTTTPAPKPKLPAFLSRILKSPNVTSNGSATSAPAAPDVNATSQPSTSTESSSANESVSPSAPVATSEPAPPVNPAVLQPPNFALAQTLKAHSGWVSSLAFSSNGKLVSASWDRTVRFWDLSTGHETRTLADKLKQVQSVAFTRDGKLLAVEDASDTVTIFDASTGARLRELPTDKTVPSVGISWVYSIAFSPDGRWLASAVDDKTVRIWDVATGAKIRDLAGPRRAVVYAAFSPNGELLATGNDEKSIQIWNLASGAPTTTLSGHKKVINAVAFSPDGKFLASASGDKTIRLWDIATGKHIRTLSGHEAAVSSISFSSDGRWLASGSWDKTVRLWNVATGKEVQTLRPDARAIYAVTFDPHGRWLAAGSEDGGVEIWQWNGAANSNPVPANP